MQMTKAEAKSQLEAFFEKLGNTNASIFEEQTFAKAMIGEAIMGFIYNDAELLSCQSLIYRFRKKPQESVIQAIESESETAPNGGGEIAFDEENFTLVLQKDYSEKVSDEDFFTDMQNLAESSLIWSNEVLSRVADKAYSE